MANTLPILLIILISSTLAMAAYNIVDFGAKPDGYTDTAGPLLAAWAMACRARVPASVYIPAGTFFVSQVVFQGPCNNTNVQIINSGTLVAPFGYTTNDRWIAIKYVNGVSFYGGTFDGRGQRFWNCKLAGRTCPVGATSIAISRSTNVLVSGITSLNSELFHILIFGSSGVTVRNTKITAPVDSPNTDGIHVQMSDHVTLYGNIIGTGDDCISMGPGATSVWVESIYCGPGHGISIGSLGATEQEAGVQNITVKTVVFSGTQNGLRIKTWAKPSNGYVQGVSFKNAVMRNVQNPILIDQNYCPGRVNCPNQSSGIKISEVSYSNIQGTSATPVALRFDCSPSKPCSGIGLQNVNLTYGKIPATSFCRNVMGSVSGFVVPRSCL